MPLIQPVPDRDGLVEAYAYPDRTWVRANFVSTVDGAATGGDGRSGSIAPPIDTYVFALLRSLADVIVVGAGTVRREGYEPVRPDEIDTELRTALGLAPLPRIAVVSASLDLPAALVRDSAELARTLVFTSATAPAERRAALETECDVVIAGEHTVEVAEIPRYLATQGMHRIQCEGGPALFGTLVEADLVDELCLTTTPLLAADGASRIAHSTIAVSHRLRLGHLLYDDDVLLARYIRDRSGT